MRRKRVQVTSGGSATVSGEITAYDPWSNVKTDYQGSKGDLEGLGTPLLPGGPVGVGAQNFNLGVASVGVTDYKKETTQLTFSADGKASDPSSQFSVAAGTFSVTFTTQPGNALVGTAIPSAPSGQSILVTAEDTWGNRPYDKSTITQVSAPWVTLAGTTPGLTAGGVATFADLSIATPGTYRLNATLNASADGQPSVVSLPSAEFTITAPGVACSGSSCTSQASNTKQGSLSNLTPQQGSLSGLFLNTSISVDTRSGCSGFTLVPGTTLTDVRVYGNVAGAKPTSTVTLVIPKATLQQSGYTQRSANSFDACLGNTSYVPGTPPWTTKSGASAQLIGGLFWGLVPKCSAALDPTNPCVVLKTKEKEDLAEVIGASAVASLGFRNSDVALVVKEPYPWDGRYGGG
jgi:hypothetical protein